MKGLIAFFLLGTLFESTALSAQSEFDDVLLGVVAGRLAA